MSCWPVDCQCDKAKSSTSPSKEINMGRHTSPRDHGVTPVTAAKTRGPSKTHDDGVTAAKTRGPSKHEDSDKPTAYRVKPSPGERPHELGKDKIRTRPGKKDLPPVVYINAETENPDFDTEDWSSDTSTDSEVDHLDQAAFDKNATEPKDFQDYHEATADEPRPDSGRDRKTTLSAPSEPRGSRTQHSHDKGVSIRVDPTPTEEAELRQSMMKCEELMCEPECKHVEEEVHCTWLGNLVTEDSCGLSKSQQGAGQFGLYNKARHLVSKSKKRYINKQDGFDLDLVYVTNRVIAMGFPSVGAERMYRNPREEVVRFLDKYHKGRWRIYNLCAEKAHQYPADAFGGNWRGFPFNDHCPPSINLLAEFCEEASSFMMEHPDNVIAVHCKAGKGRTGTMICALMVYGYGRPDKLDAVLRDYGARRSWKGAGVTIPAQIHALTLFSECISGPSKMRKPESWLTNPCKVASVQPEFYLRELTLGPFYSARINNPSLRTFFGDTKAEVDNITPEWLPVDPTGPRQGHYCRLKVFIECNADFGRIEVRVQNKPEPLIAILWVHYAALQKKEVKENDYYSLTWVKEHMSNVGKKDAKNHSIVPKDFNCEAIFTIPPYHDDTPQGVRE